MGKNLEPGYKDCKQNKEEFESWVGFEFWNNEKIFFNFTNNEKIFFNEIELRFITKTIKTIVRTYLKMKDLFTFNFKKKGV